MSLVLSLVLLFLFITCVAGSVHGDVFKTRKQ